MCVNCPDLRISSELAKFADDSLVYYPKLFRVVENRIDWELLQTDFRVMVMSESRFTRKCLNKWQIWLHLTKLNWGKLIGKWWTWGQKTSRLTYVLIRSELSVSVEKSRGHMLDDPTKMSNQYIAALEKTNFFCLKSLRSN